MSLNIYLTACAPKVVFDANITHDLDKMANEAGIYPHLWRPNEIGITQAFQLIELLKCAIYKMETHPEKFKMNHADWATFENFLSWLKQYLAACQTHPEAKISVSERGEG